jgi:hypothetical protein
MKTIIVTNPDVDGVLAASVLVAGIDTKWAADPVRFANYQDLEGTLSTVLTSSDIHELYLVDLNVQEICSATFDELIAKTRLHLVDHHEPSGPTLLQVRESGGTSWYPKGGEKVCSTELAIRAIGHSTGGQLALLADSARADDFDSAVSDAAQRLARDLGNALMPGSALPRKEVVERLVEELRNTLRVGERKPFALSPDFEGQLRRAADWVERKQSDARGTVQIELFQFKSPHFGNLSVACARVPDVLFGKIGIESIQDRRREADVAVAFFDDGECWALPRGFPHGEINLLPLLKALGRGWA